MSTSSPSGGPHPEDLLSGFALDALEEDEAGLVEVHLEGCQQCRVSVAEMQQAAGLLSHAVSLQNPPASLQANLMRALNRISPDPVRSTEPTPAFSFWNRWTRIMLPLGASAMVVLFVLSLTMNMRISDRVDTVQRQNSILRTQVAQTHIEEEEIAETLRQLQVASYWLANPENYSMMLKPPNGSGQSHGVLMVSVDGRRAILMVTGMPPLQSPSSYEVWLMRHQDRVLAGEVQVNERGWGTVTLVSSEPVSQFDKVELTMVSSTTSGATVTDMVLEGEIKSATSQRLVSLPLWP